MIGSLEAEPASESGRYESEYRSTDSGYQAREAGGTNPLKR
jgi:hypothetical protein